MLSILQSSNNNIIKGFLNRLSRVTPQRLGTAVPKELEGFHPNSDNLKPLSKDTVQFTSVKEDIPLTPEQEEIQEDINKKAEELEITEEKELEFLRGNLTKLFLDDREKYDFIMGSKSLFKFARLYYSYGIIRHYDLNQLKIMESESLITKEEDRDLIASYVRSSDIFGIYPENVKKMSKLLSVFKTDEDTTVYRGDKGTGMFDYIPLKAEWLQDAIYKANEDNKDRTNSIYFSGYGTGYLYFREDGEYGGMTLHEYIESRNELSLADAMLMMQFLDKDAREEILDELKGVKKFDDRFKSTSLRKGFAKEWIDERPEIPSIFSEITLKKGTEGVFAPNNHWVMGQYEFIVNNKRKEITVLDAEYDEEKNNFNIKTELKMLS